MAARTLTQAFVTNFLGNSPYWYKSTIVAFLFLNAVLIVRFGPTAAGWALVAEFIFCLVMALKCYPLQPGGLLVVEAVVLDLTSAEAIYTETLHNFPVIMLLLFMVAGIYFMQDLLLFLFTRMLLTVRSKTALSLLFCFFGALLSAFLDALTVISVVINVVTGFYFVYDRVASSARHLEDDDEGSRPVSTSRALRRTDLNEFRAFLRCLVMHAAVGTALGGVTTLVGEPQNLIVGKTAGWQFVEFFIRVAPVSLPVLVIGLATCVLLEHFRLFGYGAQIPGNVRRILEDHDLATRGDQGYDTRAKLLVQAAAALFLLFALAFQVAEVGVVGLTIIILQTAFNGIVEEHRIGGAFVAALPFTGLLVAFFGIVAVIDEQDLFAPLIGWVLSLQEHHQALALFATTGALSSISDNVFVATVYIAEVFNAFERGVISREHFNLLAVAVSTGTNLPSVATPNGQAAFLFLLTSALAPLLRLSYGRMVWMALPYTVALTSSGMLFTALMR